MTYFKLTLKRPLKPLIFALIMLTIGTISAGNSALKSGKIAHQNYHFVVQSGDSIARYFKRLKLPKKLLHNLLKANPKNQSLNHLKIGHKLIITLGNRQRFRALSYQINRQKILTIHQYHRHFYTLILDQNSPKLKPQSTPQSKSQSKSKAPSQSQSKPNKFQSPNKHITRFKIRHSLNYDGRKAGVNTKTIHTISRVFDWKIDFNRDLKKGDQFVIVTDKYNRPSAFIYLSGNKRLEAFAFRNKRRQVQYYDRNGNALRASFLTKPLKTYKRISSKFTKARHHPTLKKWKPHRAVDFAAKSGTPIYATANGVVKFKKTKGPLGNSVFLTHGKDYVSVYAHMSRFARKLKVKQKVKQGQTIGYVGTTGRSTGPHLHFEVRYRGKRVDPFVHKFPKKITLNRKELRRFKQSVRRTLALLKRHSVL